jgi:hypothetical protein
MPARGRSREQRVPDFFIVGHEKSGTSALDLMLKRHPQIFMPEVKEQKFFAPELRSRFGMRATSGRPTTLEGYLALFASARPDQRAGEASPQYLRSHDAAKRIAAVQPAARIIAILREPASFLRSLHLQNISNNYESERDLRKALALEQERREGRRIPRRCASPAALMYSEHVRYVEQLSRFHAVFAPEQVLTLIYEEFRADNDATVRTVLRFLDVDESVPIETVETKPLKAVRFMQLKYLSDAARVARRNPAAASSIGRAVNALTPAALRRDAVRRTWRRVVNTEPSPPDEELMLELRRRFKPQVLELSEYLGRDLVTLWGYEHID